MHTSAAALMLGTVAKPPLRRARAVERMSAAGEDKSSAHKTCPLLQDVETDGSQTGSETGASDLTIFEDKFELTNELHATRA